MPNFSQKAWYLDNKFGITTYLDKTYKAYALCVRGGQTSTGLSENNTSDLLISGFIFPISDQNISTGYYSGLLYLPNNKIEQISNEYK